MNHTKATYCLLIAIIAQVYFCSLFAQQNGLNTTPVVRLKKANGTQQTPLAVQVGDSLGLLGAYGYDGAGYRLGAGITFEVEDVMQGGGISGGIGFSTGSGALFRRMYIDGEGKVGIGTDVPEEVLHVSGRIRSDSLVGGGNVSADADGNLFISTVTGNSPLWSQAGADVYRNVGKVGIGTGNPEGDLHVVGVDGFVAEGVFGVGSLAVSGEGTRMLWYPRKGAFRAGTVEDVFGGEGSYWDADSIGAYSFGTGYLTRATGRHSMATGWLTWADGEAATALGLATEGVGDRSVAMGRETKAVGDEATAMGFSTLASGARSVSMGSYSVAAGRDAVAIGEGTLAGGANSIALGFGSQAIGDNSTAMGRNTLAVGVDATSIGGFTVASGYCSFAIGARTVASGAESMAMGSDTEASGDNATAMGRKSVASGLDAIAMGDSTVASGVNATSMGSHTVASGEDALASGFYSIASGINSLTTGLETVASGANSTAMGGGTVASGYCSLAVGAGSMASGSEATAMGKETVASGDNSTAMGRYSVASGLDAIAMGDSTVASGLNATSMGSHTVASGEDAVAMGLYTEALGDNSIAMGRYSVASGLDAIAMGDSTVASGLNATSMGSHTVASGEDAVAMGLYTEALGDNSMAMGRYSVASGLDAIAMGDSTVASGLNATSMGSHTVASGEDAVAMGLYTEASGANSMVVGSYSFAGGEDAVAIGYRADASGDYGLALGSNVSTNDKEGVFVYGDRSTSRVLAASRDHQFLVRASGGYLFATDSMASEEGSVVIDSEGNMGLGVAVPTHKLHIRGGNQLVCFEGLPVSGENMVLVVDSMGNVGVRDLAGLGVGVGSGGNGSWVYVGSSTGGNADVYRNGRVGIGTNSPLAQFEVVNGSVLFSGTSGATPVSGAGTRMMWVPEKAAFRAGSVLGNEWDDGMIGAYSMAVGFSSEASGVSSVALGRENVASGVGAVALGRGNDAVGEGALAMGFGNLAGGQGSISMGFSNGSSGFASISGGAASVASGDYSLAIGSGVEASGFNAVAFGLMSEASGSHSFAMGAEGEAFGTYSFVGGFGTQASYGAVGLGRYNLDWGNGNQWVSGDYLLSVGDGSGDLSRSNAFYIKKNGDAWLQGSLSQYSDMRLKEDVRDLEGVLEDLGSVRGVRYHWRDREGMGAEEQFGVIAQDLETVYPELITEVEGYKAVNYIGLIPVLIEATNAQTERLERQEAMIERLLAEVAELKGEDAGEIDRGGDSQLFGNRPNPFSGRTLIAYYVDGAKAELVVQGVSDGKEWARFGIDVRGYGEVEWDASGLSAGSYVCSLYVDGVWVDSKQLVLVR